MTPKFFVGARVGRYLSDRLRRQRPMPPRYVFPTNNIGMAGVPLDLQHAAGYLSVPRTRTDEHDTQTRNFVQVDATWYANAGGQHQIKGGFQLDRRANDVASTAASCT